MALPSLVSCELQGIPHVREDLTNRSHTAVFKVEVSHKMPGYAAIQLARNAGKLPDRRDTFAFTIDGVNYIDQETEAQGFTSESIGGGDGRPAIATKHLVTVEFQTIQPQTNTPDPLTPPLQRATRWGTEWLSEQEARVLGFPLVNIKWSDRSPRNAPIEGIAAQANANTASYGRITNAAGFPYASHPSWESRRPVLYYKKNVLSAFAHINIYNTFRNTTNAGAWDAFGLQSRGFSGGTVSAYNALFLEAVTGEVQYYGSTPFFELTVRVVLDDNQWLIDYPNEGNKLWEEDPDSPGVFKLSNEVDQNGQPLESPYELNYDGELRDDDTHHSVSYKDFNSVDFDALTQAVLNA